MFSSVVHFFNVLIFLDLTLAVLSCILLLKVPMRYAVKFALIPVIIFSSYILLVQGESLLGRPYDKVPVGQFEFIDYRVTIIDGAKKIELWIIQDKKSRLHIVPYSTNMEEQMARAKNRKQKGSRERGEFKRGQEGSDQPSFSIGEIPIEETMTPKEERTEDAPHELTPEELRDRRNKLLGN